METEVISKPVYQILAGLTREPRVEVALPLAMKDWVRLRLKETREQQAAFEERHGMAFDEFKQAWERGEVPDAHSYNVERDIWEWEAAVTDEGILAGMLESLP